MNSRLLCEKQICEGQKWLVGVPGRCNNLTGLCECPEGYSGTYILNIENDCHISNAFREVTNMVTFSTAFCALLGSIAAFFKVLLEVLSMYKLRVVPVGNYSTWPVGQRLKPWQTRLMLRKRLVLRTIGLMGLFTVCDVQRSAVLLDNAEAYAVEFPVPATVIYGVGRFALSAAIFHFFYIYTTSLPQSEKLEAILGRKFNAKRYKQSKCTDLVAK